jgi:PKD repeat protein
MNKKQNKWTTSNVIVSGLLTAMLVLSGLFVILPMSSDVAASYFMPSGVNWNMDDLVNNSGGAVTGGTSDTYYVHEDIYISYNSSLSVDPGETVYFDTETGFDIYGTFTAYGNNVSMITFTSNETKPSFGDWEGITFLNGSSGGIYYCSVSYAENGIMINDTSYISVASSEFNYNVWGVHIISTNDVYSWIWYNTFNNNGILPHPDPFYSVGGAIYTENYVRGTISYNDFSENIGGVRLEDTQYVSITQNNFYNSTVYGIASFGDGLTDPDKMILVRGNEFISNGKAGIYCDGTMMEVDDNYFAYNENAIWAFFSEVQINDTKIYLSTLYDLNIDNYSHIHTLNTTFDDNAVYIGYNSTLEVQWNLHILVLNTSGHVPFADVTVSDNINGTWSKNFVADSLGRVKWVVVTEYYRDEYVWVNYTAHNITAQKGLEIGSAEPYMDESKFVEVFIGDGGGPPPNDPPVADAGLDQMVFEDEIVYFNGSGSYDPNGSIVNYTWDFQDGNFGYGEFPTHIFTTSSIYDVTLTVTDDDGATDSDICVITVNEKPNVPPVADAGLDQIVNEDEVVFFDGSGSSDSDGVIVNYTWDFGDGNYGYEEFPTHIYDNPGIYIVTLTVTDDDGATDSDTCTITVEDITAPLPPTDLNAILVPGSLEDVKLIWSASEDDGAGYDDVAGYTIYKSTTGIYGSYNFAAWIPAAGIPTHTYEWTDYGAGDGDWNNYFYKVRANDTSDNEEQNDDTVGKFAWYLEKDWNLFSIPLVQSNTSRDTVLQTIEGNYAALQGYHAGKSRPWLHWHRDKPNYFNDEIEVDHKNGFYIDMIVSDYLVTAGKVAASTDITLKAGWNLIGFPVLEEQTVVDALSSIDGKYNMVEYFDPVTDKEVRLQPDDLMYPGLGYWIHATDNCVLILTN